MACYLLIVFTRMLFKCLPTSSLCISSAFLRSPELVDHPHAEIDPPICIRRTTHQVLQIRTHRHNRSM